MYKATVKLRSTNPYSQSKYIESPRKEREKFEDHEKRCWRERMHTTEDGYVFLPPMAFKNMLYEAASRLAIKIPGKGQQTYTKSFEAGVLVTDPIVLPLKAEDVKSEKLFVPSDGKKGGGKRVFKYFPRIESWEGTVTFYILDEMITKTVFERVLNAAGLLVGIGRFRPARGGFYGRFVVEGGVKWTEEEL